MPSTAGTKRCKPISLTSVIVVDPVAASVETLDLWKRLTFGSPRDSRAPSSSTTASPVRLGRARLETGVNGDTQVVHLRLSGVEIMTSSSSSAGNDSVLMRVPRAVVRSLIALDEQAIAAITANADRWFDDFELDFLEQYYRESTKQSVAGGMVVPLARFAILAASPSAKVKCALVPGIADVVLSLSGLNFQRRQVSLAWKVVSVSAADVVSREVQNIFQTDGQSAGLGSDDDVRIPEADLLRLEEDPDAWFDDAGPGSEARDEMLDELRRRLVDERRVVEKRLRDIDEISNLAQQASCVRALAIATERLGF